jgi:hypothetical protein
MDARLDVMNKVLVLENEVILGSRNHDRRCYDEAADALARAARDWLSRLITSDCVSTLAGGLAEPP